MLTVDQIKEISLVQQSTWTLLGITRPAGVPTYACPHCWARVSLVTSGAELPACCPRCLTVLKEPT